MCKKCNGNSKLISYKWNDKEMIYKYRCDECGEIETVTEKRNENTLNDLLDNSDLYRNFNL